MLFWKGLLSINRNVSASFGAQEFFKYSEKKQNQVRSLKKLEVKSDSAFHSLHYHQLSEMIVPSKPSGLERNYKKEKDTAVNKLYSTTVNIVLANVSSININMSHHRLKEK